MLDEQRDLPCRKIMKSTLNIAVLTVVWSVIYAVGYHVVKPLAFHEEFSFKAVAKAVINGHYHMWYLYVIIGLYLITPILRKVIRKENSRLIRNYLLLFAAVCFGFSFINEFVNIYTPHNDFVMSFIEKFHTGLIGEYLIYYVLGWYLVHVGVEKKVRLALYAGAGVGAAVTFLCTQLYFGDGKGDYFISNASLNVFLYSAGVFTLVHYIFENKNKALGKGWVKLSSLTFGVYLIHCLYLFALKMIGSRISLAPVQLIVIFAGCVVLSFVTVFVMSKIPLLKKLIRS